VSRLRSLRSRLLVGSVLWASAVIVAVVVVGMLAVHFHPHATLAVHGTLLAIFAIVVTAAAVSQLRRALLPFDDLRKRLADVRSGRAKRVDGQYPAEVQPLLDDLNALLEDRERMVARALGKAGDLAHGLKTPLAVLSQEAARVDATGSAELARAIAQEVDRMRGQIDRHLAQARAAVAGATPGVTCVVAESVDGLVRTLRRLYADRGLQIDVSVPPAVTARGQRADLDEMLGNLLDNACKWARTRVAITAALKRSEVDQANTAEPFVTILVDDDGPGLDPAKREIVLQRGIRADEALPGSGFGLAIVRDVAELAGGTIALEPSPLGGLRARLTLPLN
jgi:signal transduction histidine kinase